MLGQDLVVLALRTVTVGRSPVHPTGRRASQPCHLRLGSVVVAIPADELARFAEASLTSTFFLAPNAAADGQRALPAALRLAGPGRTPTRQPGRAGQPHCDGEYPRVDGQLLAGFELAPLNLELMAEAEREASLEALAALYDAIPRPFQLLSVPAGRDPNEHLAHMQRGSTGGGPKPPSPLCGPVPRDGGGATPAAARHLPPPRRRPGGRSRRIAELLRRVAEERGVELRQLPLNELTELWSSTARVGSEYRLGVHTASGDGLLAALHFGGAGRLRCRPAGWPGCWPHRAGALACAYDRCRAPRP